VERGVTITDLALKFLAQESDSAEAGNSVVAVPTPHGSSGDLGTCARFEVVERRKKAHRWRARRPSRSWRQKAWRRSRSAASTLDLI